VSDATTAPEAHTLTELNELLQQIADASGLTLERVTHLVDVLQMGTQLTLGAMLDTEHCRDVLTVFRALGATMEALTDRALDRKFEER
jgi:hypothetical protein